MKDGTKKNSLGRCVLHQRADRKKDKLSKQQIEDLDSIGFVWEGKRGKKGPVKKAAEKIAPTQELTPELKKLRSLVAECNPTQFGINYTKKQLQNFARSIQPKGTGLPTTKGKLVDFTYTNLPKSRSLIILEACDYVTEAIHLVESLASL